MKLILHISFFISGFIFFAGPVIASDKFTFIQDVHLGGLAIDGKRTSCLSLELAGLALHTSTCDVCSFLPTEAPSKMIILQGTELQPTSRAKRVNSSRSPIKTTFAAQATAVNAEDRKSNSTTVPITITCKIYQQDKRAIEVRNKILRNLFLIQKNQGAYPID